MSRALVPATVIASNCCEKIGDSALTYKFLFLKEIGKVWKKVNMFLGKDFAVESIIVQGGQYQYQLPSSFVYETKVGMLVKGRWFTLDLNRRLRQHQNVTSTPLAQINTDINNYCENGGLGADFYTFYNCWGDGEYLGEVYGLHAGWHANNWYNIHDDGVLEVSSNLAQMADQIIVEFKTDGSDRAYKLIPAEMEEVVEYGAMSKFYEGVGKNLNLAEYNDQKFKENWLMVKRLYSQRSPEYLAWLMKASNTYAPKN